MWIDQTSLLRLVVYFAVGVLSFGLVYFVLTPGSDGLISSTNAAIKVTPGVAIYFSVVTVSTLGYGDIIPQGASKILVCIEVIFGLTMMGIIVAKLTSARLSYHVRRLFSSDTQRRLDLYSSAFDLVQQQFTRLSPRIGLAFQETPILMQSNEQVECAAEFSRALSDFHARSLAFCRDIAYELAQGDFFSDAPTDALQNTAVSIEQSLFLLGQLILGFPILARSILLNRDNRRRISETLDGHRELYSKIEQHFKNEDLRKTFQQIVERCRTIPENYFSFPEIADDHRQPDQVAPVLDQPQQAQ